MTTVKYKKLHPSSVVPKQMTSGAAGFDLTATYVEKWPGNVWAYGTGIAVEIPKGYCGLLMARSSVVNTGAFLSDGVGLIDSDYRGELIFKFYGKKKPYKVGERIGQLLIVGSPQVELHRVKALSKTERGEGGYGSTGK